jgi:hypothetical protein
VRDVGPRRRLDREHRGDDDQQEDGGDLQPLDPLERRYTTGAIVRMRPIVNSMPIAIGTTLPPTR